MLKEERAGVDDVLQLQCFLAWTQNQLNFCFLYHYSSHINGQPLTRSLNSFVSVPNFLLI